MGKGKIIAGTLAGLIMAGGIAGAGYFGYKTIKDRDKTIEDQKTTIEKLEDENKVSKEKIEELTKDLSAKVSEIAEKDKQIAEKDNLIEENNHKIQTLNNQKTTLLASVSEIDNKLTSTTDAVDVDSLEARKTAILSQIDTLNTEIANLTNEKTQLEQDVATLTEEKQNLQNQINNIQSQLSILQESKGVALTRLEYFMCFFDNSSKQCPVIDGKMLLNAPANELKISEDSTTYHFTIYHNVTVNYGGNSSSISFPMFNYGQSDKTIIVKTYIKGVEKTLSEYNEYLSNVGNNSLQISIEVIESQDMFEFNVNVFDAKSLLKGMYFHPDSLSSTIIDFDNSKLFYNSEWKEFDDLSFSQDVLSFYRDGVILYQFYYKTLTGDSIIIDNSSYTKIQNKPTADNSLIGNYETNDSNRIKLSISATKLTINDTDFELLYMEKGQCYFYNSISGIAVLVDSTLWFSSNDFVSCSIVKL